MRRGLLGKGALLTTRRSSAELAGGARQWVCRRSSASPPIRRQRAGDQAKRGTSTPKPTMRERMEQHHANPVCASPQYLRANGPRAGILRRVADGALKMRCPSMGRQARRRHPDKGSGECAGRWSATPAICPGRDRAARRTGPRCEYRDMPLRPIVRDAASSGFLTGHGHRQERPRQMNRNNGPRAQAG